MQTYWDSLTDEQKQRWIEACNAFANAVKQAIEAFAENFRLMMQALRELIDSIETVTNQRDKKNRAKKKIVKNIRVLIDKRQIARRFCAAWRVR